MILPETPDSSRSGIVGILGNQETQRQQILDRHRLERDALINLLHTVLKHGIDKTNKCTSFIYCGAD